MGSDFRVREGAVRLPEQRLGLRELPKLVIDPSQTVENGRVARGKYQRPFDQIRRFFISVCVVSQCVAQGV